MLHNGHTKAHVAEVHVHIRANGVVPNLGVIYRVPAADLCMFAGRDGSTYALIPFAAGGGDFTQTLPLVARLHDTAALGGVEETIGDQTLAETRLVTACYQAFEPTYVAELEITTVLQVLPSAGCRTTQGDSCRHVALVGVTVLRLQIYRVTAICFDVPHIGSQTDVVAAIGEQFATVERLRLQVAGCDKRQEVAYLIVLQPAHELQLIQAVHGQIAHFEQDRAPLLFAEERQFCQRIIVAFVEWDRMLGLRQQMLAKCLKIKDSVTYILGEL